MENLYQLEDGVYRFGIYLDRKLGKGSTIEEAALDARKWIIDYDINAPLINFLKRTAVPFISYGYRVIPLLAEAAVLRPHKYVIVSREKYINGEKLINYSLNNMKSVEFKPIGVGFRVCVIHRIGRERWTGISQWTGNPHFGVPNGRPRRLAC